MATEIVYDLNIFQKELLNAEGEYQYSGPWYIHIYEVISYQGASITEERGVPIELTPEETDSLITNDPYFQNHEPDLWYGLNPFIADKDKLLSDRLKSIFYGLPQYAEELLF
jgi:hypothetical protein